MRVALSSVTHLKNAFCISASVTQQAYFLCYFKQSHRPIKENTFIPSPPPRWLPCGESCPGFRRSGGGSAGRYGARNTPAAGQSAPMTALNRASYPAPHQRPQCAPVSKPGHGRCFAPSLLSFTFRNPFNSCILGCNTIKAPEAQFKAAVGTVTHRIGNLLQAFRWVL